MLKWKHAIHPLLRPHPWLPPMVEKPVEVYVPPKTFDNARSFIKALEKRGFVELGSGNYSRVLTKEGSDRVIKVMGNPSGDGGWMEYIKWAEENGFAGTIAPKVYSYKWIKGHKAGFGVAVMEKINTKGFSITSESKTALIPSLLSFKLYSDNQTAGKLMDMLVPGMDAFSTKLVEKFGKGNFDIHGGNYMVRDDESFVLIDPIYGRDTIVKDRIKTTARPMAMAA